VGLPASIGSGVGDDNDMASSLSRGHFAAISGRNYCPISCLDLRHHFGEDDTGDGYLKILWGSMPAIAICIGM
jgi:hypothetical protein